MLCSTSSARVLTRSRASRRENASTGPITLRFVFSNRNSFDRSRFHVALIRRLWLWPCRCLRKCFGWGGHASSSVPVRSPPCKKFSTKPALKRVRGSSGDYKRRWQTGTRPRLPQKRLRYTYNSPTMTYRIFACWLVTLIFYRGPRIFLSCGTAVARAMRSPFF